MLSSSEQKLYLLKEIQRCEGRERREGAVDDEEKDLFMKEHGLLKSGLKQKILQVAETS